MCKRLIKLLHKGLKMSGSDRLKKYIDNQKKKGKKRVSFFVDDKVWKFFKKKQKASNLDISDYLKVLLDFK